MAAVFFVLVWSVSGCGGSGVERVVVSGTVTYKGELVPAGPVIFEPDPKRGNTGPQGFARIKDGKYQTELGLGSVGGSVIVRITCCDGENVSQAYPFGAPIFLPPYETRIELPHGGSSTQDFDVPPQEGELDEAQKRFEQR